MSKVKVDVTINRKSVSAQYNEYLGSIPNSKLHTGLPCTKRLLGIAFLVKRSKVKFIVTINRKSVSAVLYPTPSHVIPQF